MDFDHSHNESEVKNTLEELYANWQDSEEAWEHLMKRYFLACAHNIWKLLPQEASRRGIEVAEQFILGLSSDEEFFRAEYESEGAAFNIDYNCSPGDIKRWIKDIKRIPHEELDKMIHPAEALKNYKPRDLLRDAAYFAHFAMKYPDYISISDTLTFEKIPGDYFIFFSPSLLREILLM